MKSKEGEHQNTLITSINPRVIFFHVRSSRQVNNNNKHSGLRFCLGADRTHWAVSPAGCVCFLPFTTAWVLICLGGASAGKTMQHEKDGARDCRSQRCFLRRNVIWLLWPNKQSVADLEITLMLQHTGHRRGMLRYTYILACGCVCVCVSHGVTSVFRLWDVDACELMGGLSKKQRWKGIIALLFFLVALH